MPQQVFWIDCDSRLHAPEIGMGFDSRTGVFPGTAVTMSDPHYDRTPAGRTGTASAEIITDHQRVQESLDMGAGLSARYGLASGSLKARFSQQTGFQTQSTFVMASLVVQDAVEHGHDFAVPEGSPAAKLVAANRMKEFHRSFGDHFVRGRLTGGEYFAVIRITSLDQERERALSVALQAAVNGGLPGAEFDEAVQQARKATAEHTETSVSYYQASGSGMTTGATPRTEEVIARLQSFPQAVRAKPVVTMVELASYDTIPLEVPTQAGIEDLELALQDAQAKRVQWLGVKNDMEFAMQHPVYFQDPPSHADLEFVADAYTTALNGVTVHLARLARGEVEPATLFDTSTVTLPAVPQLQRAGFATTAGTVTVPDFSAVPYSPAGPWERDASLSQLARAIGLADELGLRYTITIVSGIDPVVLYTLGHVRAQHPPPGSVVPAGYTVALEV